MTAHDLDGTIRDWIEATTGAALMRCEPALARRTAWIVDVDRPGADGELFLRLAVDGDPANSLDRLWREVRVVETLAARGMAVPAVVAADREVVAVLFARRPGRWQLHEASPAVQDRVYSEYVAILAELHALDARSCGLDDVLPWPDSPSAVALDAAEAAVAGRQLDPLAALALSWMRRHHPSTLPRTVLVHGDAGVGNFLYDGDHVTSVIDWEWGHFGDPMEDLAALAIHASFFPSGDLARVFRRYQEAGGADVDLDRVRYYRVENMLRSILVLADITARVDPRDPVGLNLAYRLLCERFTCDALADAMGIEVEAADALPDVAAGKTLLGAVATNLRVDVAPAVSGDFAAARLDAAARLVDYLERRQVLAPALDAIELDELAELLGHRPDDTATGWDELSKGLLAWGGDRDPLALRYLTRRARRAEAVAAPLVALIPPVELRPIEAR